VPNDLFFFHIGILFMLKPVISKRMSVFHYFFYNFRMTFCPSTRDKKSSFHFFISQNIDNRQGSLFSPTNIKSQRHLFFFNICAVKGSRFFFRREDGQKGRTDE